MSAFAKLGRYGAIAAGAGLVFGLLVYATAAHAQSLDGADQMAQPYGMGPGDDSRPITTTGARDANGNLVIVNGAYASANSQTNSGVGVAGGGGLFGSSATAIGNQLNVVTQGSWNTVIIENHQENNGDVSADVVLNGGLKL